MGGRSVAEVWTEVRHRFAAELEPHFRIEEEHLLPALEAVGEAELVARTRKEHRVLREAVHPEEAGAAALKRFGERLERHIRFEERVLFPTAEKVLDDDALQAVGRAREARGEGPDPAAGG